MASAAADSLSLPDGERRRSDRPEVQATRSRILAAAERLYAERGFQGVSLREIATAAGQGNNNAVQYHFGSRERLIDAIFHARTHALEEERADMLADAEGAGRLYDPATLLAIISRPHLSLRDERGHHPHAGFMLHYLTRRMDDQRSRVTEVLPPTLSRVCGLLRQSASHLPQDILGTRTMLCALMFMNVLMQHDSAHPDGGNPERLDRQLNDTIGAMAAALCHPCDYPTNTA